MRAMVLPHRGLCDALRSPLEEERVPRPGPGWPNEPAAEGRCMRHPPGGSLVSPPLLAWASPPSPPCPFRSSPIALRPASRPRRAPIRRPDRPAAGAACLSRGSLPRAAPPSRGLSTSGSVVGCSGA
ncbi:unnamed protein product, partial [Prorocentrum cordatum]